ncbi:MULTISPECIES: anthranilate synthase component II [Salinibaculum]|uniref:anthranilate synthase component II n=1 Tax=Salinibaculum TaxID=2732368 RepID=UPI0030CB9379
MRVLVVDNYDSFAYNLVQYVGAVVTAPGSATQSQTVGEVVTSDERLTAIGDEEDDSEVVVRRNDEITLADVDALAPDAIVVSPGPGTPEDAGISMAIFAEREYPTLGVCLGHQALCAASGGRVGHADAVVHGKPSTVVHDGDGIFAGLPERFEVGRYHSLSVDRDAVPDDLVETARTEGDGDDSVVMAVRHRERPHVGVQFHPESILTDTGERLVANFLREYATPTTPTTDT